jgi:hypothetical protein
MVAKLHAAKAYESFLNLCKLALSDKAALEALRDYFRRRGRSMDELIRAARVCRVARVMMPYIETLISNSNRAP